MDIFIGSVEVRPRPGAKMYDRAAGGFTYCFVRSEDVSAATDAIKEALNVDCYDIVRMEWVRVFDECEWETPEEQMEHDKYAKEADATGNVVYAPFYTYSNEKDL